MARAQCSYLFWGCAGKNWPAFEAVDKDRDKRLQKLGVYWTRYVAFNVGKELGCCFYSDFDI
jgi:hypothetical protein